MEETPKYILSRPKAPDIFTMASIIGAIGVNKFASCLQSEEVQKLVKGISKKKTVSSDDISMIAGVGVFTEVAQIVLVGMPVCEEKVYKLLSDTSNLSIEEVKVEIGQTMAFMVLAFSELVHVFSIRDNKNSIFKTGILGNRTLILAVLASAFLMGIILIVPGLRHVFSIPVIPTTNIIEIIIITILNIPILSHLFILSIFSQQ